MFFIACVRENLPAESISDGDGPVTVRISMAMPEVQAATTRAALDGVSDNPDEEYLKDLRYYLFVFEDTGNIESNYLRELVYEPKISNISVENIVDDTYHTHNKPLISFDVTLDGTSENAIIHLVATSDPMFESQLQEVGDRTELGLMAGARGLWTSDKEAYWKRINLGMPICKTNADEIQKMLRHIPMVRNFARITLEISPDAFDDGVPRFLLDGFVVVNAADYGYITAYNERAGESGKPGFIDFVDENRKPQEYKYITGTLNYIPASHPLSKRSNPDDDLTWVNAVDWNTDAKYVFESPVSGQHRPFIIAKGHYEYDDTPSYRYVKLDIGKIDEQHLDPDHNNEPYGVFEPFDLVRNISYDMTITKMPNVSVGQSSPEVAISAAAANNISTSLETRSLFNIYDGKDHMQVAQTTIVIVDDEDGNPYPSSADIKWRYYENYSSGYVGTPNSSVVRWNFPGYAFMPDDSGIIATWSDGQETPHRNTEKPSDTDYKDYGDDWYGFPITFNIPDEQVRVKTIRLYKPYGVSRDVTLVMRKRWEFVNNSKEIYPSNVEVYPGVYSYDNNTMPFESLDEMREYVSPGEVGSMRGAQLTVMFELPADLPQAIFPLDFKIGFDRQNVENAYVGNATVVYGESMFEDDEGGVGVPRMQFIKTVPWKYYNDEGHRIVTARFLTTTDVIGINSEEAKTRVRVTNPYFLLGEDSFDRKVSENNPDPDPYRTVWSWYFSDPGWTTYFYENGWTTNTYSELWFANIKTVSTRSGVYLEMAEGHNETNPEFKFDVNFTVPSDVVGYKANLYITGASNWFSHSLSALRRYFRRQAHAIAIVKKADGSTENRAFSDFDIFDKKEDSSYNDRDGITDYNYRGLPEERSAGIELNPGETVESVIIWSETASGDNTNAAYASTLYYGIRFALTEVSE